MRTGKACYYIYIIALTISPSLLRSAAMAFSLVVLACFITRSITSCSKPLSHALVLVLAHIFITLSFGGFVFESKVTFFICAVDSRLVSFYKIYSFFLIKIGNEINYQFYVFEIAKVAVSNLK
jgi:hypothetical protein